MNAELKKERAIDLIVSIFHYGKFKAETPNEKELETILRELRLWPTSESEIVKRSEWYESQPLTEELGEGEGIDMVFCYHEAHGKVGNWGHWANKVCQPLTEGEGCCGKCRGGWSGIANQYGCLKEDCPCHKPQQESNKEECKNESGLCIPEDGLHFRECPSHYKNKEALCFAHKIKDHNVNECIEMIQKDLTNKEEPEIDSGVSVKKFKNGGWCITGFDNEMASSVIRALSDIYIQKKEPSKKPSMTIGCGECGNNITI